MPENVLQEITPNQVEALVDDFRCGRISPRDWTHEAHLVVATWHCLRFSRVEALARVRNGILALNAAQGVPQSPSRGFHETMTRVYMCLVWNAVEQIGRDEPLAALAAGVVERLADRSIPLRYYSRDVLSSSLARTTWVPPDAATLEGLDDFGAA